MNKTDIYSAHIQGQRCVCVCVKVTHWGLCRDDKWLTVLSQWLIWCPDSSKAPYVYQKQGNNSLKHNFSHYIEFCCTASTAFILIHSNTFISLCLKDTPSAHFFRYILPLHTTDWNSTTYRMKPNTSSLHFIHFCKWESSSKGSSFFFSSILILFS